MTQTTSDPTTASPIDPFGLLNALLITLLAPMFLSVCRGDIFLARRAASATLDGYRTSTHADLIAVAQIIAFGLAAIASISLSLADDIPASLALRLRANANACNRAAQQNRRALSTASQPAPEQPPTALPKTEPFMTAAAEQLLAEEAQARLQPAPPLPALKKPTPQPISEKRHQEMWAIAMAKEASDIEAGIPNLPEAERKAATIKAAALGATAHDLLYGTPTKKREASALVGIIPSDPPPPTA